MTLIFVLCIFALFCCSLLCLEKKRIFTVSCVLQKQAEAAEKTNQNAKGDAMQKLKSTIIISAVIVAVAGAAFAVTKKLREK